MYMTMKNTLIAFVLILFVAGCNRGPNTASVSGVLTINGQPLSSVEIVFQPIDGQRSSVGYTDEKGQYSLRFTQDKQGAIPGKHFVRISAYKDPEDESSQFLPKEFNAKSNENPDLNVEIKRGRQMWNYDVVFQEKQKPNKSRQEK